MTTDPDELAAAAKRDAARSQWAARFWWANLPAVCGGYWVVSTEPAVEKAILIYLAAVSIIALAVTYEAKAKAGEAKAAGYENP